jgi:hypothetical protein
MKQILLAAAGQTFLDPVRSGWLSRRLEFPGTFP